MVVETIPAPRPPIRLEFTVEGDNADACFDAAIEWVHDALGGGRVPVDLAGFKDLRMRARAVVRKIDAGGHAITWEMDVVYVDDRGSRGR